MQLLRAKCPYCNHVVETTIEHVAGPVVCPNCERPFELEMPTATVSTVREVDESSVEVDRLAGDPAERTLIAVHPVIFRSRPVAAVIVLGVGLLALGGLLAPALGYQDDETMMLGALSLLAWTCVAVLVVLVCFIGYWILESRFSTLTVTDQRTIHREGIVSRDTSEVQHDDVRNMQVDQSIAQRLLSIGDIGISSSGQDDLEIVARGIPHPERVIELIRENQDR